MDHAPPDTGATTQRQPAEPLVAVPYIAGMLRWETEEAVSSWGGRYALYPLERSDPYSYATLLESLWARGFDLVIVEHDIVPAPGMIKGLLDCEALWCSHYYHVGSAVYTTGLGLCKFSRTLQEQLPGAAQLAAAHPKTGGGRMDWTGLNESIERVLTRRAVVQHVHEGYPAHLHYPEPHHAG